MPVGWLPDGYGWSVNAPRAVVRKCPALKKFQQWLVQVQDSGWCRYTPIFYVMMCVY